MGRFAVTTGREAALSRIDFAGLGRDELETIIRYGRDILACREKLAVAGRSVLSEALGEAKRVYHWRHYPPGDVYDPASHAQYFYHAHPPDARGGGEHGHFHAFLRAAGLPPHMHPLVMPELAIAGNPASPAQEAPSAPAPAGESADAWVHLIAISMDRGGRPLRLFATNRWVTGETWYAAADVAAMLGNFDVNRAAAPNLLDRWLTAMLGFHRPLIGALLVERDAAIMGFRRRRRGKVHVLEDRRLEIVASAAVDVDGDLRRAEAALRRVA